MTTSDQPTAALPGGGAMPLLGFGTWQITGTACTDAVRAALDAGYRHLDTATMYRNEAEVGDRKSTRLNSSHLDTSRMPSSA